jgi:DNA-binding MarR family transcriptional regulator
MEKQQVIQDIIGLQQQFSRVGLHYAFESWRKLDVPVAQLKSLFVIANKEDTNFRTLAQDLGVTPGNVTGIVDRLVEQGLVSRNPSPEDRRIIRLQATEKGYDLLSNLIDAHTNNMVRILDRMSTEDLLALSKGLTGLIRALADCQEEFTCELVKEKPDNC